MQFTYPAGDPSLQVTDTFFKKCSFMSWSSFCAEHGYSDCAKFFICTMKLSMLPSTAVKSNGKLSAPSTRSLFTAGCCCARRACARPPGALFASTGALMWMKSSSKQERTADRPAEPLTAPRLCMSNCYWKTCLKCVCEGFEQSTTYPKSRQKSEKFFEDARRPLGNYRSWKKCGMNAGYGSPWSIQRWGGGLPLKTKITLKARAVPTSFQSWNHEQPVKASLRAEKSLNSAPLPWRPVGSGFRSSQAADELELYLKSTPTAPFLPPAPRASHSRGPIGIIVGWCSSRGVGLTPRARSCLARPLRSVRSCNGPLWCCVIIWPRRLWSVSGWIRCVRRTS